MMTPRFQIKPLIVALLTAVLMISALPAFAQAGSEGTMIVTATDSSGAVIPGATLTLTARRTNDKRTATTGSDGSYTFPNLAIGDYTLTISKKEYATRTYTSVVVQASHVTTITAAMPVGSTTQTIQVNSEAIPVMETSSNAIGSVIDVKQIEDLPLQNRDITAFARQVPGYNGTFNGLPSTDQGNNINGMASSTSRMKFGGNMEPDVSPRLEDIEQMTVQTDQLDLNSGFGQATTQINFVSRRGSNQFHGRLFEDFQNSWLNANTWRNDAVGQEKSRLILNDFGGTIGGPAIHDRLFFFGSFATRRVPGGYPATNNVFTGDAQNGNFTLSDGRVVNVLDLAHSQNPSLPGTINPEIASQLSAINSAVSSAAISSTNDPNLNSVTFNQPNPTVEYHPAVRVDYNASSKARFYLSWLMDKSSNPGSAAALFPGSFSNTAAGNASKNYTASFGFNYTFSPTVINQFTAGYLYDSTLFAWNAAPLYVTQPSVGWDYAGAGAMSGQSYQLPINTYYPILNFDDAITVQKRSHTLQFGASWYREQDHYWNAPGGFYNYDLGVVNGDPAADAISPATLGISPDDTTDLNNAQQLYAILTGRIDFVSGENSYNIKTGQYAPTGTLSEYPLDEVASAWGLFFEDSWKVTPTLTLNYGLRWDIYAPEKDLTGQYHSADEASVYGPTAVGDLFHPGSLKGVQDPIITVHDQPYAPWRVTPQPAFGFAWNPRVESGSMLHSILGNGNTVIRGGYAIRRFSEPYQYFWDYATDFGQFYYQQFGLAPSNTGQAGTFAPGSLSLGDTVPPVSLQPPVYEATAHESEFTFLNNVPGVNGIEPNLRQPYTESWNFGIQRMVGPNLALEVRYNGNRALHQWIGINPNEVNVFENGFLKDFQNAQANLAASGGTSFSSSYGNPTPILDAAFGGPDSSDYKSSTYRNYLNRGEVGALANVLSGVGVQDYFCNLVGASFTPCANIGYTGAGAGYPINFFQANPYAAGSSTGEMVSAGYNNYNGLQVDLRQGNWHGLEYDANYTWSHSLGTASPNDWTGAYNAYTLRDMNLSYGPSLYDLRHVLHASGTYDLPFGEGRQFLNGNHAVNEVLGGWTVGTIATWQSGRPFRVTGGNTTFNDFADGGVVLNGVTASQLQSAVGVHRVGRSFVDIIDPKYMQSPTGGRANPQYITANTTPGTIGQIVYLHGPKQFFQDISVSKAIPIHETYRFRIQASFLNAWNHPDFAASTGGVYPTRSITSSSFGEGGITGSARHIELRANFEF